MSKKAIILKPKKSIPEVLKQFAADKKYIQEKIMSGKEHELKEKFKFVKSI